MTDEQKEAYRKVFEEDKKKSQAMYEQQKQEAIQRRENGKSHPSDWQYFIEDEGKSKKIAHKDEKIAHLNTMEKVPATILLILGMIGSLIFKQWYYAWIMLLWWYFGNDRV